VVIVAGWVVFWCYWLVAAWRVKPGNSRWSRYAGARIVIAIVVIYLVRTLGFRSHRVGEGPVLSGVGLALFVLGLALAVWARLYIGRNWGTPMSRKDEPELVTTGPYRRRTPRHARMRCVLTRFYQYLCRSDLCRSDLRRSDLPSCRRVAADSLRSGLLLAVIDNLPIGAQQEPNRHRPPTWSPRVTAEDASAVRDPSCGAFCRPCRCRRVHVRQMSWLLKLSGRKLVWQDRYSWGRNRRSAAVLMPSAAVHQQTG
jgi:hypothetical protein